MIEMPRTYQALALSLLIGVTACADSTPPNVPVDGPAEENKPLTVAVPAVPSQDVIDLLDKLEARGADLHSLKATITYDKNNVLLGDRQVRMGDVVYLAADAAKDQPARFVADFRKMVINGALRDRRHQFIFDGQWLVEKQFDTKMFQKRQVVAPGEKFEPLNIDGPFPLPIGQKRDAVLARFNVEMIHDGEGDSAPLHLRLTPRSDAPKLEHQKQFDRVELYFDRASLLPVKVVTVEGQANTTVELSDVEVDKIDAAEAGKLFDTTPPAPGSGWNVDIKPWGT
ncbi:MAG: hypothetical protein GC162_11295 [Planctomycetes bacterium]|nr:hypothetical protein [Planctomycetota bacterium]